MKRQTLVNAIAFALVICFVFFTSCSDDDGDSTPAIKGCTNPNSINYKPNATEDDGSCCLPDTAREERSLQIFDLNPDAPTGIMTVANIVIKKKNVTYRGQCNNKPVEYANYISVRNFTRKKISFSYTVYYRLNLYYWTYGASVTVNPTSESELQLINSNPGVLGLAAINYDISSIFYE